MDLILTFTLGGLFGIACTVPRFVLAVAHLFSRLVIFQQPILPARLARIDTAFVVYGGMLKATFMPLFDDASAYDAARIGSHAAALTHG
jgi:hypothetical protein